MVYSGQTALKVVRALAPRWRSVSSSLMKYPIYGSPLRKRMMATDSEHVPEWRRSLPPVEAFGAFDPSVPVEEARTPPSSWYTSETFERLEKERVFNRSWVYAGAAARLGRPGSYFTGNLMGEPFVVLRDESMTLRAYYNVCRHHGTRVVDGEGCKQQLVCPYHGWTYSLDGRLRKATRLKNIRNFKASEIGLVPIDVAEVGPFVFINFCGQSKSETSKYNAKDPPKRADEPIEKFLGRYSFFKNISY